MDILHILHSLDNLSSESKTVLAQCTLEVGEGRIDATIMELKFGQEYHAAGQETEDPHSVRFTRFLQRHENLQAIWSPLSERSRNVLAELFDIGHIKILRMAAESLNLLEEMMAGIFSRMRNTLDDVIVDLENEAAEEEECENEVGQPVRKRTRNTL